VCITNIYRATDYGDYYGEVLTMIRRVSVPETEGEALQKLRNDEDFRYVLNAKTELIKLDKFSYLRRRLGKDIKVDVHKAERKAGLR